MMMMMMMMMEEETEGAVGDVWLTVNENQGQVMGLYVVVVVVGAEVRVVQDDCLKDID